MQDIKTITNNKLNQDLKDSYEDIGNCTKALRLNIIKYSGGSVQERLDNNKRFVEVITAEIDRRKKTK